MNGHNKLSVAGDDNFPCSPYSLDHISDDDLHVNARLLVGRSNQLLAALLAHLAEVEARGIHRERACSSLYTYCIYELRFSEDEAFRRARAAKIARQFPVLFEQVAAGEIHLTGILMLGPHLTEGNHLEVLALAKHRKKKELQRLVRRLNPLPDVKALVEPLGPEPRRVVANPTWTQMIEARSPAVRELPPGDRPRDWTEDGGCSNFANRLTLDNVGGFDAVATGVAMETDSAGEALSPLALEPQGFLEPQRYKVQFTATQEYVDLLETAKDLLAHAVPSRSIEEVHLRAMRAFVAELEKRKMGVTRQLPEKAPSGASDEATPDSSEDAAASDADPRQRGADRSANPRQRGADSSANPRQRGRHVPRAVRREVWERDGQRCTYVDATGQRCRETGGLELDHIDPHARGGPPTVANLRVRCRAHNALTADQDFGREFMARKKGDEREATISGAQ